MRKTIANCSLSVISGALLFLAFPPFKLYFLVWISLVPLLIAMWKAESAAKSFLYSYLAGIVFFGLLMYWLVNVTVPGMIILVAVLGLFFGLFGTWTYVVVRYGMELLVLPFLWVALEYARGHFLTGFPWGILGYTQYENTSFIQIADVIGASGISFLIVLFNTAFFSYILRKNKKVAYLVAAVGMIFLASTYGVYRLNNYAVWDSVKASVVQGNIPQELKWDAAFADKVVEKYSDLTRLAAADRPDLIVWPETSYPYLVDDTGGAREVSALAAEVKVPVLAGLVRQKGGKYYNQAVLFSEKGEESGAYSKMHLVPFGEYIPFAKFLGALRGYVDKPIGDYAQSADHTLFTVRSLSSYDSANGAVARSLNFYRFGVLICFEDIFPDISREFVSAGASFLVNITNDAWFGDTAAAEQHLQASVFRAVENRVPVIRSANTGVSCFVDSTGEIVSRVSAGGKDVFIEGFGTAMVEIPAMGSFYAKYGDVFSLFSAAMFALVALVELLQIKKERV